VRSDDRIAGAQIHVVVGKLLTSNVRDRSSNGGRNKFSYTLPSKRDLEDGKRTNSRYYWYKPTFSTLAYSRYAEPSYSYTGILTRTNLVADSGDTRPKCEKEWLSAIGSDLRVTQGMYRPDKDSEAKKQTIQHFNISKGKHSYKFPFTQHSGDSEQGTWSLWLDYSNSIRNDAIELKQITMYDEHQNKIYAENALFSQNRLPSNTGRYCINGNPLKLKCRSRGSDAWLRIDYAVVDLRRIHHVVIEYWDTTASDNSQGAVLYVNSFVPGAREQAVMKPLWTSNAFSGSDVTKTLYPIATAGPGGDLWISDKEAVSISTTSFAG
jgi:hypothetical protein